MKLYYSLIYFVCTRGRVCVCVRMCARTCAMGDVWRSQDNLATSQFSPLTSEFLELNSGHKAWKACAFTHRAIGLPAQFKGFKINYLPNSGTHLFLYQH